MGGRARLGWLWEARRGGASVIILRLFFRGASTMCHASPMFPTDGLTTKTPPSIAASVTLHLQKMRSAVARGWGGCGRLIWAARV